MNNRVDPKFDLGLLCCLPVLRPLSLVCYLELRQSCDEVAGPAVEDNVGLCRSNRQAAKLAKEKIREAVREEDLD